MLIKKRKLTSRIYLLQFDTQRNMAETFLRFQEYYESPKFRGKFFSRRDFIKWYRKVNKKFSYYKDWNGFNIPSFVLKPFREGKFNPLTKSEKKFLSLFRNVDGNFYIIAFHGRGYNLLQHELAHALFTTNHFYKKKILSILKKYNLEKIKRELKSIGDYGDNVFNDEIQAYTIGLSYELKSKIPKKMATEINKIFSHYCPKAL